MQDFCSITSYITNKKSHSPVMYSSLRRINIYIQILHRDNIDLTLRSHTAFAPIYRNILWQHGKSAHNKVNCISCVRAKVCEIQKKYKCGKCEMSYIRSKIKQTASDICARFVKVSSVTHFRTSCCGKRASRCFEFYNSRLYLHTI